MEMRHDVYVVLSALSSLCAAVYGASSGGPLLTAARFCVYLIASL
jgi:hypothetical protein